MRIEKKQSIQDVSFVQGVCVCLKVRQNPHQPGLALVKYRVFKENRPAFLRAEILFSANNLGIASS
jgi:hypothetical protein